MDIDNSRDLLNLNNANTTRESASRTNYATKSHPYILSVIAILGFVITLSKPGTPLTTVDGSRQMNATFHESPHSTVDDSPLTTVDGSPVTALNGSPVTAVDENHIKFEWTMKTFIIEVVLYLVLLIVLEIISGHANAELEDLMNKICLLFGTLPVILELLILVEPFGWFVSFIWFLCFVCFLYKYLPTVYNNGFEACRGIRKKLKDRKSCSDEADNRSISNDEGDIEIQPQTLKNGITKCATEHQSPNHNSVTDHIIAIPHKV